jgi:hypothetical protein
VSEYLGQIQTMRDKDFKIIFDIDKKLVQDEQEDYNFPTVAYNNYIPEVTI